MPNGLIGYVDKSVKLVIGIALICQPVLFAAQPQAILASQTLVAAQSGTGNFASTIQTRAADKRATDKLIEKARWTSLQEGAQVAPIPKPVTSAPPDVKPAKDAKPDPSKVERPDTVKTGTVLKLDSRDPSESVVEPGPHIALIVPTANTSLNRMADALRRGFLAGAEADGRAVPVRIYSVRDEGDALANAMTEANNAGAVIAVGGITRDGATVLAVTNPESFATSMNLLALNLPQQPSRDTQTMSYITLGVETEARLAAQNIFEDGFRNPLVVASSNPLGRRMQEAFEREWQRIAGAPARAARFSGIRDGESLKTKANASAVDSIFFAMNAAEARLARPYLVRAAMFGTSQMNEFSDSLMNLDLNGTRFSEMPWLVQADHPAVATYTRINGLSIDQQRMYALGIDAYRLATVLIKPRQYQTRSLDGVTGKLEIESDGSITRTPAPAELVEGRAVARP
jgi:uncharacterized protein